MGLKRKPSTSQKKETCLVSQTKKQGFLSINEIIFASGVQKEKRTKYSKNHQIVSYDKLTSSSVSISGKVFVRRQAYAGGYYFECSNARRNEHIQGSRENNCSSRVFICYPLLNYGTASLIKNHDSECGNLEITDKINNHEAPQSKTIFENIENKNISLYEVIKDFLKKDPTINNKKVLENVKQNHPKEFGKITRDDVKFLTKKIKQEMDYNTISYAIKNPNTLDDQPFLRGHRFSYFTQDKENKKIEYMIWISNSQILRAIQTSHFYIDGTFDTVPLGFMQMLVVMTNDPITYHPKPLAYILLNGKCEEIYKISLRAFKEILTNHGNRELGLKSVTLDFEVALLNAVSFNFPNIKTIGCLFHLKNALWRWARGNELGNKNIIDTTSELIDKLVALCWCPEKFKETIKDLKSDYRGDFHDFLTYFEDNYAQHFETGALDYTDINQHHRANSCLESYHHHLQTVIPSKPSWYQLVEGLKKEEYDTFTKQINNERNGQLFASSSNFSKKIYTNVGKEQITKKYFF